MSSRLHSLVEHIKRRNARAIGEAISLIENNDPLAPKLLHALYPRTGHALRIGVSGLPGAGKSTIINRLVKELLAQRKRLGIILVDPTSPYTGGALLGDRIRLRDVQLAPHVFIRSMASRGRLGGLSLAAAHAVDLLDAARFDIVLLETVGVGQLEIDIAHAAHITLVVITPEAGDEIQAMKAGLLEVADIIAINKMDLDPHHVHFRRMKSALAVSSGLEGQRVPEVLPLAALHNQGIDELLHTIFTIGKRLQRAAPDKVRECREARVRIMRALEELMMNHMVNASEFESHLTREIEAVIAKRKTPIEAGRTLLRKLKG